MNSSRPYMRLLGPIVVASALILLAGLAGPRTVVVHRFDQPDLAGAFY